MTFTVTLLQISKAAVLFGAIALIVLFNWYASKTYFSFRSRCPSYLRVFASGSAVLLIGFVAPVFAIAYLGLWAFDWMPPGVAGYCTAAAEMLWGVVSLSIIVRHSLKYWRNRSPHRFF